MKKTLLLMFILICGSSFSLEHNYFRRWEEFDMNVWPFAGRTIGYDIDDTNLINRIIKSYQFSKKEHLGNSMWQSFFDKYRQEIHNAFSSGNFNKSANILRNPKDNELFYGFESITLSLIPNIAKDLVASAKGNLDLLVRFGESISAIRLDLGDVKQLLLMILG